jgi:predicted FMN-binding regulatory protein PaiB
MSLIFVPFCCSFGGEIEESFNKGVTTHIVANPEAQLVRKTNLLDMFQGADKMQMLRPLLKVQPSLIAVSPAWIKKCSEQRDVVPTLPYLIVSPVSPK